MRALLTLAAIALIALAMLLWLYRGARVFAQQMGEYEPTPYASSEEGRDLLGEAAKLSERVGWTLEDGTRQNAFYVPPRNGALIVYAHGSPGFGLAGLAEARALAEHGYGALLVDLPGYGLSEGGRAWDAAFVESIRRALDFAESRPELEPGRIGGFGYSNGGCLMARVAAEDERLAALVLLASYTRLADQLRVSHRRRTPLMGEFAIAAARWAGVPVAELDTVAALRRMRPRPTLVMSGGSDETIPIGMAEQLKDATSGAEMIVFEGIGHVGFPDVLGERYLDPLLHFWNSALGVESFPPIPPGAGTHAVGRSDDVYEPGGPAGARLPSKRPG